VENQRSMLYIENLAEFIRLIIDDAAEGIFCPQNNEYVNTSEMVNFIAHANGKGILMIRGFSWAIRLLRPVTGIVDKAFGSLCYDFDLSRYPKDYCVKSFQESILETEQ
jgi:UDP-glucose 4-epimerase